jgi:uncharacterized protein (TIGR03000 family)
MVRSLVAFAGIIAVLAMTSGTFAQPGKVVTLEVWLPDNAALYVEGRPTQTTGPVRTFVSPPLPAGKYTYTLSAVVPGPQGAKVVTRQVDIRPGDFELVDLRDRRGKEREPDCSYEPTPQNAVDALLQLAKVTKGDVLWDLGCGDGRIPVTAARRYGIKARGFDLDPGLVKQARDNARKNGVEALVTLEKQDVFTLDLSKEPTIVTLYLLPRLNARLLPQLQKLPRGARVISVNHRLGDIKPDQQVTIDTERGEFYLYLWRAETLQAAK